MSSLDLSDAYLAAKKAVIALGFQPEIEWQEQQSLENATESDFLREAAWVILSSGMRESVVRGLFPSICRAFMNWPSARALAAKRSRCRRQALQAFHHEPKIDAILHVVDVVAQQGFTKTKSRLLDEGVRFLQTFPYLGPATSYHLAKNLGMDVVKPDRHLLRVTEATGFGSPDALCREISRSVGDRMAVVDLVIWRFATLSRTYVAHFAPEEVSTIVPSDEPKGLIGHLMGQRRRAAPSA